MRVKEIKRNIATTKKHLHMWTGRLEEDQSTKRPEARGDEEVNLLE